MTLNKWTSTKIEGETTAVVSFDSSTANLIEISVSNIEKRAVYAVNSKIVATKTNIRNMKSDFLDGLAFYLERSNLDLKHGHFTNIKSNGGLGSVIHSFQSATIVMPVTILISNSNFESNTAKEGGSICLENAES